MGKCDDPALGLHSAMKTCICPKFDATRNLVWRQTPTLYFENTLAAKSVKGNKSKQTCLHLLP